jgi:phosphoribosylamine--glycine ligase
MEIKWDIRPSVCVVMASEGYPGSYQKGEVIEGLDEVESMDDDVYVFHAGTAIRGESLVTSGGRVLGVTALGPGIRSAITKAYRAVGKIRWKGVHYRKDIGQRALGRLE